MTNATNNNTNANKVNNNESKPRALRYIANDAAKAEMFSLKGATNAVKCAYDADKDAKDVRAYVRELGFSAQQFKALTWEELKAYAVTKSGRFSTYAVICALKKYADAKDLKGEFAEKQARKEAREKMKAEKEAAKHAKKNEVKKAA